MNTPDEHMIALVDEAADLARKQQIRAKEAEAHVEDLQLALAAHQAEVARLRDALTRIASHGEGYDQVIAKVALRTTSPQSPTKEGGSP